MNINRLKIVAVLILCTCLFAGTSPAAERKISIIPELNHSSGRVGEFQALIIGIQDYNDPDIPDLETPLNDAREVVKVLKGKYGFKVKTLLDKRATKKAIYNSLREITGSAREQDSILIYYAGHGDIDRTYDDGWWIPVDAKGGDPFTYLDNGQIQKAMASMRARHVLLISDSCYSGTLFGKARAVPKIINEKYYLNLYNEKSRWGMTSGNKTPVSDSGSEGHSVFAYQLIKALKNNIQPYICVQEIYTDIAPIIANNSEQQPLCRPIKNTGDMGGEFVFIAVAVAPPEQKINPIKSGPVVMPKNTSVTFDDILNASEKKKKEKQEWQKWQAGREADFSKVKQIDKDQYLTADQKKEAWRRMLGSLSDNNPYTQKDDEMREFSKERIFYWSKIPSSRPDVEKEVKTRLQRMKMVWPEVGAGKSYRWKMAVMFPKSLPVFAEHFVRFSKIVEKRSQDRLRITVYFGRELMPPHKIFDAVSTGDIQVGGSIPRLWADKIPAAIWFASVPFGLNTMGMQKWLHQYGGIELWEQVYQPYNIIPRPGGLFETSMGGWYNREIDSINDFKGLKVRMPGLGGKILEAVGASLVSMPGGEINTALKRGEIDATEWLGPYHDMRMGLHKSGKYYYYPGWHEPGTNLEFIFNQDAYGQLPPELQQVIDRAAFDCENWMINQMREKNTSAYHRLIAEHDVRVKRFPDPVLKALKNHSDKILERTAESDPVAAKVYQVYNKIQRQLGEEASSLFRAAYLQ